MKRHNLATFESNMMTTVGLFTQSWWSSLTVNFQVLNKLIQNLQILLLVILTSCGSRHSLGDGSTGNSSISVHQLLKICICTLRRVPEKYTDWLTIIEPSQVITKNNWWCILINLFHLLHYLYTVYSFIFLSASWSAIKNHFPHQYYQVFNLVSLRKTKKKTAYGLK